MTSRKGGNAWAPHVFIAHLDDSTGDISQIGLSSFMDLISPQGVGTKKKKEGYHVVTVGEQEHRILNAHGLRQDQYSVCHRNLESFSFTWKL